MRKIFLVIVLTLSCVLTGCHSTVNAKTFMLTRDDATFMLYTSEGEQVSDAKYTSYVKVENNGYVVTNDQGEVGYINNKGKVIIDFGEYATLEPTCEMLYATKKVEEKKTTTEESTSKKKSTKKSSKKKSTKKKSTKKTTTEVTGPNYVDTNLYVLDLTGKVLYTASKDTTILKTDVPVIYDVKDETYQIIHDAGDLVDESDGQVQSVSKYTNGDCIIVNYKDYSLFYDFSNEDVEAINVSTAGDYKIMTLDEDHDASASAYDSTNHILVYLNVKKEHAKVVKDIVVDNMFYDDNDNLICANGDTEYILNGSGVKLLTSYYHSSKTYVERNEDIYGPHNLYYDGDKIDELDDCQVYPKAYYVDGNLFPVYYKGKGYKFVDFSGNETFKYYYDDALPFDYSGNAIVKNDKGYYLINKTGKALTKNRYDKIEALGKSYYAAYNEQGMYAILNATGKEVLPMGYTLLPETPLFYYDSILYLLVNKNGRSYLYDVENNMKEVLSIEGRLEFNDIGIFEGNYKYYTFEGEEIK